ncbi:MAG: S8 family serine peptidase, partial [Actinobacteria bacterium]|nr:S8 family serine peptidase [Actinomycetota bacterium]
MANAFTYAVPAPPTCSEAFGTSKRVKESAAEKKIVAAKPERNSPAEGVTESFVVMVKNDRVLKRVQEKAVAIGGDVEEVMSQAVNAIAVELTTRDAQDLANDPGVLSVEVDAKVSIYSGAEQVNAPWGLDRVDQRSLPLSTTYEGGGEGCGVIVYVVDTGLRATHEEFAGRVASGYDAVDDDFNPDDCQGHGTHVAGTAVGTKYGVAKEATVVGVRVLDCWGSGSMSDVVAGLDWVRTNHSLNFPTRPAVVNMSLGGGGNNTLDAAVNNLVASGIS